MFSILDTVLYVKTIQMICEPVLLANRLAIIKDVSCLTEYFFLYSSGNVLIPSHHFVCVCVHLPIHYPHLPVTPAHNSSGVG